MQKTKLVLAISVAFAFTPVSYIASATIQDDFTNPTTLNVAEGVEIILDETAEDSRVVVVIDLKKLDKKSAAALDLRVIAALTAAHVKLLSPDAISGLSAEQIARLSPEAIGGLSEEQLSSIHPEAMAGFTAEQIAALDVEVVKALSGAQIAHLTREAVGGFTLEQFQNLSDESIGGFTALNMGGISAEIVKELGMELLAKLNYKVFISLPVGDVLWFLVNMDRLKVKPAAVVAYLPAGWSIHPVSGKLKIPKGKLKLKKIKMKGMPIGLVMPAFFDLNMTLALGGKSEGEPTIIEDLNKLLGKMGFEGFSFEVQVTGLLKVKGKGAEFNFIADMDGVEQLEGDFTPGLSVDEDGNFVFITDSGLKITLLNVPKDPAQLLSVIPGGKVEISKKGRVKLVIPGLGRVIAGSFDAAVLLAPAGATPGITVTGTPGVDEEAQLVYPDGTMQIIFPSVANQETLLAAASSHILGKLKFKEKGRIVYVADGLLWTAKPAFDILTGYALPPLKPYVRTIVFSLNPRVVEFVNENGDRQLFYCIVLGPADGEEDSD